MSDSKCPSDHGEVIPEEPHDEVVPKGPHGVEGKEGYMHFNQDVAPPVEPYYPKLAVDRKKVNRSKMLGMMSSFAMTALVMETSMKLHRVGLQMAVNSGLLSHDMFCLDCKSGNFQTFLCYIIALSGVMGGFLSYRGTYELIKNDEIEHFFDKPGSPGKASGFLRAVGMGVTFPIWGSMLVARGVMGRFNTYTDSFFDEVTSVFTEA